MIIAGFRCGLTLNDMDDMDIGEILDIISVTSDILEDSKVDDKKPRVRKATQEDIDRFFG